MTLYNRIRQKYDMFVTKGAGFTPKTDTKKITLSVGEADRRSMLILKEYYDSVWGQAKDGVKGTDLEGNVHEPNISSREAITFGYLRSMIMKVRSSTTESYGVNHTTDISKTFVPYMRNSIHNLLRHDILYGLNESKFNETLYGKARLIMISMAVDFIVWMTVYGFGNNKTLSMWLSSPEKIAEVFPKVPQRLYSIEDSTGQVFDKGQPTETLLRDGGLR